MVILDINDAALIVVVGHYGSGKTNLTLNLALQLREEGKEPRIIDLDVVNPYFRSTDYQQVTEPSGITVMGPVFGNSNLDAPSLSPGIETTIREATVNRPVLLDVGGDADGARALARFVPAIEHVDERLVIAVVNLKRPETQTAEENLMLLQELAAQAQITIDALIGNTHLAEYTTLETVRSSLDTLQELSRISKIPLIAVTIPDKLETRGGTSQHNRLDHQASDPKAGEEKCGAYDEFTHVRTLPVKRLVTTNWQ